MDTLGTLLEAVNHASTEQRGAIDALVSTTSSLLEQAGARFGDQVDAGAGVLDAAAARVDAGVAGVASLGESLAGAVQQFGESNAALTQRLEGIAAALEAAGTRSDEQLVYYVAQAREVVDLSVLAQKQIIGELRQLPAVHAGADAA
jgi:ABC-type transporter Mla subunit MlaD